MMSKEEMLTHVDHTYLKPFAVWADIETLCKEAIEHHTASVCIPPSYIKRVNDTFGSAINICTVIGFPLGYSCTEAKACEIRRAMADGANELDMVINLPDAKNGEFDRITEEIKILKGVVGDKILKVIIETCFLTEEEKIALCGCVTAAGADYIKTSTGFGTEGATMNDILLFKTHIGPGVKIKAAGGIRSVKDMELFLEAGCDRLGTSSAIKLIQGEKSSSY